MDAGGSGFIASHITEALLRSRYNVVVTVRSEEKGHKLKKCYESDGNAARFDFVVVNNIIEDSAFDEAARARQFHYVIHTACPYHFNIQDPLKDFLEPAVRGTVGILHSVRNHAPTVKRVILLSSSATILNPSNHSKVYDETMHGTTSWKEAMDPRLAYRASKIYAESAAFDFISIEKPTFDLVVLNPPLVFGAAPKHIVSPEDLNTSNERIRDMVMGCFRETLPPTGPVYLFADVRDVAEAHVKALEAGAEAGGQRFFIVGGHFSNKRLADAVRACRPELGRVLPDVNQAEDDMPKDVYGFDNSKSREVLGLQYTGLEVCVRDTVESILAIQNTGDGFP
ncbi:ketoreductase [Truncatella angustata]|uniref:Ketoreductase n=1 Tax=Truncatella angustata TaxID=152316 RepID=A0A9P9A0Y0_9PEZI|nr:ketoreductase [Truncatella angustata]KAH6658936.1 ketoreductase [Truncatella angustata]KAH8196239.1 hypothetical protein TruAng_009596 [Truncatella angustata]